MEEVWKDIKNFENKYILSTKGRVISLNYNNTRKPKELKPKLNKQGYLEVKLSKNNKTKDFMLSRLVIETFTKFKLNKNIIILYKDNDATNCGLDNLYYTSRGKYQEFTYDRGRRKINLVEYNGNILPIKKLPLENGVDRTLARERLKKGWSVEEAISVPRGILK